MIITEEPFFNKEISVLNDFVYNRLDLFADQVRYLTVDDGEKRFTVQYSITDKTVHLGVWLSPINQADLNAICRKIFETNKGIKKIAFQNVYSPCGWSIKKNHFRICFPDTVDELQQRLSKKGQYNIKRELKLLSEQVGTCEFREYTSTNVPEWLFDAYFLMKAITHGVNYGLTAEEYIRKYHVSDIYTLFAGDMLCAVLLSCEQCSIVYIENLTYCQKVSKFSPGQILYDYYLKRLIEKGKKEIYLAGGNLDYKRRYGSIEETVYDCTVYRYKTQEILEKWIKVTKKTIKKLIGRE